jgi:flagellar hook-basal body complex protein FliE
MTPVSSIVPNAAVEAIRSTTETSKPGAFRNVLEGAIQDVERFQNDASTQVGKFLSGENEELHTAALATQKAEMAFELGLQVRNKVVAAYQEIMRMPM